MDSNYLAPILEDNAITTDVRSGELAKVHFWAAKTSSIAHWRTSYKFSTNVGSLIGISVDMYQPISHVLNAEETNRFGSLKLLTTSRKLFSTNPAVLYTAVFKKRVNVENLINLIIQDGRHHYKFHPDGSGCMYWQLSLLQKFESFGWLENGSSAEIVEAIQTFRNESKANAASMPWPPRKGEYYSLSKVNVKFYRFYLSGPLC
jgi:hypothetical protein